MSDGRNPLSDARSCLNVPLPAEGGALDLCLLYTATARRFLEEAERQVDEIRKGLAAREAALTELAKPRADG